ncbi:hypothetical protein GQ37_003380 [Janthinobacterium sp. BJB1]|nr:hypothetical protein GQ37_003380 [Janthinobacterium sp. BJB1]
MAARLMGEHLAHVDAALRFDGRAGKAWKDVLATLPRQAVPKEKAAPAGARAALSHACRQTGYSPR